jgi:hypothetical protein
MNGQFEAVSSKGFEVRLEQVIGVQVDHAGRRASAASRSSCTSLRYC